MGIARLLADGYIPRLPLCGSQLRNIRREANVAFGEQEVELRVGDSLWLGQIRVTVVDIDQGEVVFQVDDPSSTKAGTAPDIVVRPR